MLIFRSSSCGTEGEPYNEFLFADFSLVFDFVDRVRSEFLDAVSDVVSIAERATEGQFPLRSSFRTVGSEIVEPCSLERFTVEPRVGSSLGNFEQSTVCRVKNEVHNLECVMCGRGSVLHFIFLKLCLAGVSQLSLGDSTV